MAEPIELIDEGETEYAVFGEAGTIVRWQKGWMQCFLLDDGNYRMVTSRDGVPVDSVDLTPAQAQHLAIEIVRELERDA